MSDLLKYDLLHASIAIKKKEFSSVELTNAYIKAIEDTSPLGTYLEIVKDKALNMAANSDKNISKEFQSNEIFKASDMMVDSLTKLLDAERKKRKIT